jgi:hypothetical protein
VSLFDLLHMLAWLVSLALAGLTLRLMFIGVSLLTLIRFRALPECERAELHRLIDELLKQLSEIRSMAVANPAVFFFIVIMVTLPVFIVVAMVASFH